ncbi:E3 SUMO-protein ligase NSE2-like [Armigeres subalbatus]|uniref:E3 SUMO-protein ligase NSE2-like n=1 Tax=Armigeres subalbatus TaxID=124917 RepID=UPI002ED3C25C
MADMFGNNMDKIFESISNTARLANEYGSSDQKNIKVYGALAEKLVAIEQKFNGHKKALQESSKEITLDEFDRRYKSSLPAGKSNVKQLKRYKEFITHTGSILQIDILPPSSGRAHSDDEEMEMEEVIQNLDPITKRPLEVPVRNKLCKHVYEKSAIEEMVRTNPRTRCPAMGCAADQFVTLAHLEEDENLRRKLMLQREQEY